MINDFIIIIARIHFKTTEEGGRKTGIKSGYRPNHAFEQTSDIRKMHFYIGDIRFDDQELFQPGETKIVTVRFLRIPIVEQYIKVGQRWFIYEVPRLVAEGEIIKIVQS